jgi:hypothetical protein
MVILELGSSRLGNGIMRLAGRSGVSPNWYIRGKGVQSDSQ